MNTETHSTFDLRPLSPVAGVEVRGIDLRNELPEQTKRELYAAWQRHGLLLFRDQDLDKEQQTRAVRLFGEVCLDGVSTSKLGVSDGVSYVSNIAEMGAARYGIGALGFHRDNSYYEHPPRGLTLHAIEIPPPEAGGDTLFSNMQYVYRNLPDDLRAYVDTLTIRQMSRPDPSDPQFVMYDHPLAFKHPDTGETVLYLSYRQHPSILGVSADESARIIETLREQMERPEAMYRHQWRVGDFVAWDNFMLVHARTDFDQKYRRYLRRILIA